ncbi:sensor histidine kinase [Thalassotalea fusca]
MAYKKFSLLVIIRTLLAIMTLAALSVIIGFEGYQATMLVLALLLVLQLFELTHFITKTNQELVRFFSAVRHADFSQRFEFKGVGSGFEELGQMFSDVLKRIQHERNINEEKLQHMSAIVEHVPVPLISIYSDNKVSLWNNSARQLFGRHSVTKTDDLVSLDAHFLEAIQSLQLGEKRLVSLTLDQMEHRLLVSCSEFMSTTHRETLYSLQDVQSEIASTQIQAWQELVSVLTHEIMNSITPVASLAKTTVDLVEDVQDKTQDANNQACTDIREDLHDIHEAVQTVARRSENLTHFVNSYRQLTKLPTPNRKPLTITSLFSHVTQVFTQEWHSKGIRLTTHISPSSLDVYADHHMLEQVLINLLRNAEQAVTDQATKQVSLSAFLNPRGHVVIEVTDNGTGIASDIVDQIFVPFFTTKKDGSGVGLALTRQIMLAHNGKVSHHTNTEGGATFRLIF